MIQAAIFDMDGLLIDSEPLWKQAQAKVFGALDVPRPDVPQHHFQGWRLSEVVEYMHHKYGWEGASQMDVQAAIVDGVVALIKERVKLKPGARQALETCRQADLKMALASGSPVDVVDAVLDKFNLQPFFDEVYSADHEPYGKPHPGVFISAAGRLETLPRDCLVFEDAPNGVLAAKAAKMKCIAVPTAALRDNPFVRTADVILGSLTEFDDAMLAGLKD